MSTPTVSSSPPGDSSIKGVSSHPHLVTDHPIDRVEERLVTEVAQQTLSEQTPVPKPKKAGFWSSAGSYFDPREYSIFQRSKPVKETPPPQVKPTSSEPKSGQVADQTKPPIEKQVSEKERDHDRGDEKERAPDQDTGKGAGGDQGLKSDLEKPLEQAIPKTEAALPKKEQLEATVVKTESLGSKIKSAGFSVLCAPLWVLGKTAEGVITMGAKAVDYTAENAPKVAESVSSNVSKAAQSVSSNVSKAVTAATPAAEILLLGGKAMMEVIVEPLASGVASGAASVYLAHYEKGLQVEEMIAFSKGRMKEATKDPQFIEMYEFLSDRLTEALTKKIRSVEFLKNVNLSDSLISKLIRINLARAFANLSEQIPKTENQNALVSIISLICGKIENHASVQKLAEINQLFNPKDKEAVLKDLEPLLTPLDANHKKKLLESLVTNGDGTLNYIVNKELTEAFGNLTLLSPEQNAKITQLVVLSTSESEKNKQFKAVFDGISNDLLITLFPKKIGSLELPDLGLGTMPFIYDLIKDSISDFMIESYLPLQKNLEKTNGWKQDIQRVVGQRDADQLVKTTSVFLVEAAKNYINKDPAAVTKLEEMMSGLAEPKLADQGKATTPQDLIVAKMADTQLAAWVLTSLQKLLQSQDPAVFKAASYITEIAQNLTLGVLAQSSKLVISNQLLPVGQVIPEDQFVKKLMEGLIEQAKALGGAQNIPKASWEGFIQDLPLPPLAKELLVSQLTEKSKDLPKLLKPIKDQIDSKAALAKINGYPDGAQLLSFIDNVTNTLVDMALKNQNELFGTIGISDTLDDLLAEFLPGVKIDEELKLWVKTNISAFGEDPAAINSVTIIKEAIRTFLIKSISDTIETNFKNNEQQFMVQLLSHLQGVFQKIFPTLKKNEKQNIEQALLIKAEIAQLVVDRDNIQKDVDTLKLELASCGVSDEVVGTVHDVVRLNTQSTKIKARISALENKKTQNLLALNKFREIDQWNDAKLKDAEIALAYLKENQQFINQIRASKPKATDVEILQSEEFRKLKSDLASSTAKFLGADEDTVKIVGEHQKNRDDGTIKNLVELLNLSPENLKLIQDCLICEDNLILVEIENLNVEKDFTHHLKKLSNLLDDVEEVAKDFVLKSMESIIQSQVEKNRVNETIATHEALLDKRLESFQKLADETLALIGWTKDKYPIPEAIPTKIRNYIARIAFDQLHPVLTNYFDKKNLKKELDRATQSNFMSSICTTISKETIERLPSFLSYRVAAQKMLEKLPLHGEPATEVELENLNQNIIAKIAAHGKQFLTLESVKKVLDGKIPSASIELMGSGIFNLMKSEAGVTIESLRNLLGQDKTELELKAIMHEANQLILNTGRTRISVEDLREIYVRSFPAQRRKQLNPLKQLDVIRSNDIVGKIQNVVISIEELSYLLNSIIPGAEDFHSLVAPQLQSILTGRNPAFQANWDIAQKYIESVLLKFMVDLVKNNGGENFVETITQKLKTLVAPMVQEGVTKEEVAEESIATVIEQILGITSKDDLKGIPPAFQQLIYENLVRQLKTQLMPHIMPIVERQIDRAMLDKKSNSPFLSELSSAIAKDAVAFIPTVVKSYRTVAENIYDKLSNGQINQRKLKLFQDEIAGMVKRAKADITDPQSKAIPINNKSILAAYEKSVKKKGTFAEKERAVLLGKLRSMHALSDVSSIVITPEEVASIIAEAVPNAKGEIQAGLADRLKTFIQTKGAAYQNVKELAQQYVEDVLLKAFLRITEKNPPQDGKDVIIVVTEKLVDIVKAKIKNFRERPLDEVIPQLTDEFMKDILGEVFGIESQESLEGLPKPIQAEVYKLLKDQIAHQVAVLCKSVQRVGGTQQEVEEARRNISTLLGTSAAEVVLKDLGTFVVDSTLATLNEVSGGKAKGRTLISESLGKQIQVLAKGNWDVVKVLQNYANVAGLEDILEKNLNEAQQLDQLDKAKAAEMVANIILPNLNRGLTKLLDLEDQRKEEMNRSLITSILNVATEHLQISKAAKDIAAAHGSDSFTGAEYVQAANQRLHPAVPVNAEPDYTSVIEKIKEDLNVDSFSEEELVQINTVINDLVSNDRNLSRPLRPQIVMDELAKVLPTPLTLEQSVLLQDLIVKAAEANTVQRVGNFYQSECDKILKMLFPNGSEDLIPSLTLTEEEKIEFKKYRKATYKLLKDQFPTIMKMIVETTIEPDMMTNYAINSLEVTKEVLLLDLENMAKGVKGSEAAPESPLDDLDRAAGALVDSVLDYTKLPPRIVKMITDPVTGKIGPDMQKTIGRSLRGQFNQDFIKRTVKLALEKTATRDASGKPLLNFETGPKEVMDLAKATKKVEMETKLASLTHEVIDINVSYFLRTKYPEIQKKWGDSLETKLGRIGSVLRKALDGIMNFIFKAIVWALFEAGTHHLRQWIKDRLENYIKLDENLKSLMDMLRKAPEANEDLAFKLVGAIGGVIQQPQVEV
ncbi:MAG: hypothetical protein H0W88_02090 [Parachlamydiaceae bacterium]|nr:hypothetical protein [Parachlamydiaceae bacterium]